MKVPQVLFGRQLIFRVQSAMDDLLKYQQKATVTDIAELLWHNHLPGEKKNEQFAQLRKRVKDCVDGLIHDMYHYHIGRGEKNQPVIIITSKKTDARTSENDSSGCDSANG